MLQVKQKNLVEVCPQCCKSIDSSANRLVHDACGHKKCRICLLQEITGCLQCVAESKSTVPKESNTQKSYSDKDSEQPQRKSVITSLAIQIAEQKASKDPKLNIPSVDKDTCHLIKQSLEKDILFPTDIVNRSTGNFYHLKRVFSQRFFNEGNNKRDKACETEDTWPIKQDSNKQEEKTENKSSEKQSWRVPSHIQVQYYCTVHKLTILEKSNVESDHMTCNSESTKTETLPHVCSICNKKFKLVGKLNRHHRTHLKSSKFKCEKCEKVFIDNYALRTHERSHTKEKPYACQYCDKKFSGIQNHKRHERKHRGEKRFICNECGFRFLTNAELKKHAVTHTKIKAFTCLICNSKFSFKRTLARHLGTHDVSSTKIKCSQCESTFRRRDNLERHIKMAHSELKTENNYGNQE